MKIKFVKRPWGSFQRFVKNKPCTVKIHTVLPNQKSSLQYHKNRDEFLKIINGEAKITIGDKIHNAKTDDEFFIKREIKHRWTALKDPVKILEISFGKFDEKEIIRLEDEYGRV